MWKALISKLQTCLFIYLKFVIFSESDTSLMTSDTLADLPAFPNLKEAEMSHHGDIHPKVICDFVIVSHF